MDTRYLKRRGQRWYFQVAVPRGLHAALGRKVIVEALNTPVLAEAQNLRWSRLAAAHAAFDAAGETRDLGPATIDREAQATLSRLLREAEAATGRGEPLQWAAPDAASQGQWPGDVTEGEGLTFALETFTEAMSTRNYALVEVEAAAVVISLDLGRDPADDELDLLCRSQLAAHTEAIKARLARLRGQDYAPDAGLAAALREIHGGAATGSPGKRFDRAAVTKRAAVARDPSAPMRIGDAAAACLADHAGGDDARWARGQWSAQTRRQYAGAYELLADHLGNMPLALVTAADARGFIDAIAGLDPLWRRSPGAADLSFAELVQRHTRPPGLNRKTVDRYVAAGSALFVWAAQAGAFDGANPFDGLAGSGGTSMAATTRGLSDDELRKLFAAPLFRRPPAGVDSADTALFWSVLLGLFGGLRLDEIAHLECDDVRRSDGSWVMDAGRRPRKRGRLVPVHDTLMDLGFVDHVEHAARLGPAAVPMEGAADRAARLVRAFTGLRRRQGLATRGHGFRVLRATARAALTAGGAEAAVVAQLMGDKRYRMAPDTAGLAAAINAIRYPAWGPEPLRIGD